MPRIPESEIERIKKETDLAALVRSRGIELKKHGTGNWAGCCPFHTDSDPSFIVTPSKGLFHCMGCGAAGNAIQFVQRFDGVSFRHAFELLNEGGTAAFGSSTGEPVKAGTVRRLENPFDPEASDHELMNQVIDYYHERLLQSKAALDYLKKRGLHHPEQLAAFRIGFSDRSLGLRLPNKNRADGKAIRERLEKLGIYRESGHEHFNGSLVLPIFNESGDVVEMYGRRIGRQKSKIYHLYLPGPHAGIWNATALDSPAVILCEAPLDALTFTVNGFDNATFIYGCQGFTDELFSELVKNKVQTVRLAYDNDDAGNRAAARDAERLASVGIEVYRIKFPHGMDANEYATKVRPAPRSLEAAVKSAEWLGGKHDASPDAHSPAPSSLVELAAKEKAASPPEPAPSPVAGAQLQQRGEYRFLALGQREYRVGGLEKNNSLEVLKITLRLRVIEGNHRCPENGSACV